MALPATAEASEPTGRAGRVRWRLLVVPALQTRVVLAQTATAALFAIVVIAALLGPDMAVVLSPEAPKGSVDEAAERLLVLHEVVWPSVALGVLFVAGISLLISHRFAGPLIQFRRAHRALGEGRVVADLRLRKRDLLHEDAAILNRALAGLRDRVAAVEASRAELDEALRALRARVAAGETPGAALDELEERARAVRAAVQAFAVERSAGGGGGGGGG